jgi:hypothetical protein
MEELRPFLDRAEPPGTVEGERRRDFWKETEIAAVGIAIGLAGYYVLKQLIYPPSDLPGVYAALTIKVVAIVIATLLGVVAYVFWRRSLMKAFAVILLSGIVIILNFNIREMRKSIESDPAPDHYEAAMVWIRENVPPGEMVFNTDWDDFPKMFFYDTKHTYASGLDPTYLLDRDIKLKREPKLSDLFKKITLGNEKDPGPIIRDRFGARYVFSDNEEIHENFFANAIDSGWFDQIHIYTVERKDGRPLTPGDIESVKRIAPAELTNWIPISNGRRVVTGAIKDFTCADVNGLCEMFLVNKDIDSTVLRIRDEKGQPPPESQEEMGGEGDDEGGGDEEPDQK